MTYHSCYTIAEMVEFDISDLHVTLFSNSGFHEDRVSKSHMLLLKAVNDIIAIITKFLGQLGDIRYWGSWNFINRS
jgi:hypothetical protein